jgi:hypothetical protein
MAYARRSLAGSERLQGGPVITPCRFARSTGALERLFEYLLRVTEAPEASGEGHRAGAAPLDQYAAASKTTFALSPLASSTLNLFDQYAAASKASFALSPLASSTLKLFDQYAAASKAGFALSPLAGLALKPLF